MRPFGKHPRGIRILIKRNDLSKFNPVKDIVDWINKKLSTITDV